jgi:hypothetical protein
VAKAELDSVDARLHRLAELSASAAPPPDLVDMSAEAISARLRECAEISALALELELAGRSLEALRGAAPTRPRR